MASQSHWHIEFDADAARDLRKLGHPAQQQIMRYLRALTSDLKGLWRYRVGDYRIVAKIEDDRFIVLVLTVGHRREVYE
jgi:mRNA interferase RelE/StbE